jgi:hypothetical protein
VGEAQSVHVLPAKESITCSSGTTIYIVSDGKDELPGVLDAE